MFICPIPVKFRIPCVYKNKLNEEVDRKVHIL